MIRNPLEWVSEALVTVTTIPVLAMKVHVTLDVVLKYTVNTPIQGTLEVTAYYYMVAIVVLPMGFVELTRQSIAVELFYQMMPPRMQVAVVGFVLLLSAIGYGGVAWISWPDAIKAFERKEIVMGAVRVYIWPARFLLPCAMMLAAAVCLMLFARLLFKPRARAELTAVHTADIDHGAD